MDFLKSMYPKGCPEKYRGVKESSKVGSCQSQDGFGIFLCYLKTNIPNRRLLIDYSFCALFFSYKMQNFVPGSFEEYNLSKRWCGSLHFLLNNIRVRS